MAISPEIALKQGDSLAANRANELEFPIPHMSSGLEKHNLAITDLQRRIESVHRFIRNRAIGWAKENMPWTKDPVEQLSDMGVLRPLKPGEKPFILKPEHIVRLPKLGGQRGTQRYVYSGLYGKTNLAELNF